MTDGAGQDYCGEALASVGVKHEAAREQEAEIKQLAGMSHLEYCQRRKLVAKRFGIGVGQLDTLVREARKRSAVNDDPAHWLVEPALEAVDGATLLDDIKKVFSRYIVLPKGAGETLALWVLHAWTMDAGDISPFMVLVSPTKRCGKTNTMILLLYLTPRSELSSNISASALFRYIQQVRPTLLIDEADSFLKDNEEMRGILDSGHTKAAASVVRNVEINGEHKPQRFSTWAPKAIATIGALADTLEDRSIVVRLQRKPKTAKVARLRRCDSEEFAALRGRAARWAADNFDKLADPEPEIPDVLNDRAADNWRPLLAIADLADGTWPKAARHAACLLSGEEVTSVNVDLLAHSKIVFGEADAIRSADLVARLVANPEWPWAEWNRGKALTQKTLATLLRDFGIISETVHIPDQRDAKGYKRAHFEAVWDAYLSGQSTLPSQSSPSEASKRPNADAMGTTCEFAKRPDDFQDGSENADLSNSRADLDAWTDPKAGNGPTVKFGQDKRPDIRQPITAPTTATDRLCDHCGGGETPANPLNPWDWPGRPGGILLHRRCEEPWFDSEPSCAPLQPAGTRYEEF
jgi:putative DNA primase/helicase